MGSQQHQHHNESSCSSGPDSPRHPHSHPHSLHGGGGGGGVTAGASSAGVGSVTGAMSKELPLDTSSSAGGSQGRAQYLSATCVVFTNYSGDTASVVDEHFSRALNYSNKETKGRCPIPPRSSSSWQKLPQFTYIDGSNEPHTSCTCPSCQLACCPRLLQLRLQQWRPLADIVAPSLPLSLSPSIPLSLSHN